MQINFNLIKQQLVQVAQVTTEQLAELTVDKIAEQLTSLGLEIDHQQTLVPAFTGVKVGKVISCSPHPNADKLQVTQVDVGDTILDIVCGASNCRLGLLVACAVPGAVLPGNFTIKQAKLRGVISNGMLCSFAELGINIEQDGIIELDANAVIGTDIRDYLKLDDSVYEISITPNRGDCLSALGLARDLSALNDFPLKPYSELQVPNLVINDNLHSPQVELLAEDKCPVYYARLIKGVDVKAPTPLWMKIALSACGVRSIDPIVDVTNYVLYLLGQPLHAFDAAKIEGNIIVRNGQVEEKLTLLSGQEISLSPEVLVIADQQKALALAGIFGGQNSGVSSETQDIVLEAAFFQPLAISGRARKYKLATDSSHRFERGVDPSITEIALNLASKLIIELCGGELAPYTKVGNQPSNSYQIPVTVALINRIAGIDFTAAKIAQLLTRLGVVIVTQDNQQLITQTPSWRFDLTIAEDLSEEVIRIYCYDNIPKVNPVAQLQIHPSKEKLLTINQLKDSLIQRGFQEIISYSFVDPKQQALVNDQPTISLPNPISMEMSEMRANLLTGLLTTLSYNQKRQQLGAKLFEVGLTFIEDPTAEMSVRQEEYISLLITGNKYNLSWNQPTDSLDFYDLKGYVEDLLAGTNKANPVIFSFAQVIGLHPGQTALIKQRDEVIGFIGAVHPVVAKSFALKGEVYIAQIKTQPILQSSVTAAVAVSKFPVNKRDLAFVIDKKIALGDFLNAIKQAGGVLLLDAVIFDVFTNKDLGDNLSVAVNLTIGNRDKTMEDHEITALLDQIIYTVSEDYNAKLRN